MALRFYLLDYLAAQVAGEGERHAAVECSPVPSGVDGSTVASVGDPVRRRMVQSGLSERRARVSVLRSFESIRFGFSRPSSAWSRLSIDLSCACILSASKRFRGRAVDAVEAAFIPLSNFRWFAMSTLPRGRCLEWLSSLSLLIGGLISLVADFGRWGDSGRSCVRHIRRETSGVRHNLGTRPPTLGYRPRAGLMSA
jgi:hypothetical protein